MNHLRTYIRKSETGNTLGADSFVIHQHSLNQCKKRQKGGKGGWNAITVECAHKMRIKSIRVNYKFKTNNSVDNRI